MLYNVLLQADLDDTLILCDLSDTSRKICHNQHWLNQKFDTLPFHLYKPIKHTFNNLVYIYDLVNLSTKLMNFMSKIDGIQFYFMKDGENIEDIKNPSLYNQLIMLSQHLNHPYINYVNVPLDTQPDITDEYYGAIDYLSLMYKNGQFSIFTGIGWPHFLEFNIPIPQKELIEYFVNIFLNDHSFTIGRYGSTNAYPINNMNELEQFIIKNPNDVLWEWC